MSDEDSRPPLQDRRAFLATLGGAALAASGLSAFACATNGSSSSAGAAAGSSAAAATTGGVPLGPIGVQLYTVRDEMQRDVAATLARVARIGYKEVEFAGYFGHTPADIRGMLDANGLTAPSAHIPLDMIAADPAAVAAAAKVIGHEYIVVPWLDPSARGDWHGLAKKLNDAGTAMSKAGLRLGYHNHDFEFAAANGVLPYDIIVNETDPSLVCLEMDLYWATKAGQDPVAWFAKEPGRIQLVHLKDAQRAPGYEMAPVGSGTIDWRRILSHRAEAGIRHYFVEHDNPTDAFASIAASYTYISALRV